MFNQNTILIILSLFRMIWKVFTCLLNKICIYLYMQYIPMPVLYGVFFYMGVSALRGMQVHI